MLTHIEIIASLFGTYGAFIMVIPDIFEKYCFCFCKSKKVNNDEYYELPEPTVEWMKKKYLNINFLNDIIEFSIYIQKIHFYYF